MRTSNLRYCRDHVYVRNSLVFPFLPQYGSTVDVASHYDHTETASTRDILSARSKSSDRLTAALHLPRTPKNRVRPPNAIN